MVVTVDPVVESSEAQWSTIVVIILSPELRLLGLVYRVRDEHSQMVLLLAPRDETGDAKRKVWRCAKEDQNSRPEFNSVRLYSTAGDPLFRTRESLTFQTTQWSNRGC